MVFIFKKSDQDIRERGEFLEVLKALKIPKRHLDVVEEISQPNMKRTYHNVFHCVSVALRAHRGAEYYGIPSRDLVLAGLYHDAAHPGLSPDVLNIEVALDSWGKDDDVARLIASTEFPGVEPERLDERIIRDADVVQAITDPTGEWNKRLVAESSKVDLSIDWVNGVVVTEWGKTLIPEVAPPSPEDF